jgi:hypothetical protein
VRDAGKSLRFKKMEVVVRGGIELAWFHGERSQQRVTGRELAILTALLLVADGCSHSC